MSWETHLAHMVLRSSYCKKNVKVVHTKSEREIGQIVVGDVEPLEKLEAMDLVWDAGDLVLPEVQHPHVQNGLQVLRGEACDSVGAEVQLLQPGVNIW